MNRSMRYAALIGVVTAAIMVISMQVAVAGEDPPRTYRKYDDRGRFAGTIREAEDGNRRFYDKDGQYDGYAQRQKDGSWRVYDRDGQFNGTIREDSDRK